MITLRNDFHGTEYRTHMTADEMERIEHLTFSDPYLLTDSEKQKARRIRHRLCGGTDCKCSRSVWGTRERYM